MCNKKVCFCVFIFFFSFSILLFAESSTFTLDQSNDQEMLITFTLGDYLTSQRENSNQLFTEFALADEGETYDIGYPQLPLITRFVAIPSGAEITIAVETVDTILQAETRPYPRQSEDAPPQSRNFTIDTEYYHSGTVYPSYIAQLGNEATIRDFSVVPVTIAPFQYNPLTNSVTIVNEATISISWDLPRTPRSQRPISRAFESTYRSLILNYEEITRDAEYQTPCYLFIIPDNPVVYQTIEPLLTWKREKGFEVHMATTTETGATAIDIKSYIQTAYTTWENPPEYVCLVGDASGNFVIPCFLISGGSSDHTYTLLEGNDILSDIHIGRLSYADTFELQTILNKIFKYEKEPYVASSDWFEHAVLVGDPSTSGQSCVDTNLYIKSIIENFNPHFSFTELYVGNFTNGTIDAISNGTSYYNYRGYFGMSGFTTSSIDQMTNGFMLPFAVTLTCGTGNLASNSDCISEHFVNAGTPTVPKGAIAAVATATVSTHTTFNNCVSSGIYTGIFVDDCSSVGAAFTRGKTNLSICYPQYPGGHVMNFSSWNNLIGDPGLRLWKQPPELPICTIPSQIPVGQSSLTLQVLSSQGNPVQDAWITIYKNDENFASSVYTDEEGMATLEHMPSTAGDAIVTITGEYLIPLQQTVTLFQETSYLHCHSVLIDDDSTGTSSGNNDSLINPGETIELGVVLHNSGTTQATGISATLSTLSPWVIINDAIETYPDIAPQSTVSCLDDFDITISNAIPYNESISFTLEISDDQSNTWSETIELAITTPILSISNIAIYDSNNQLDPGETAQIGIQLHNSGLMDAGTLSAILRIPHTEITVMDSVGSYPAIASGTTATNQQDPFTVEIELTAFNGMQIPLQLILQQASGCMQTLHFLIDIGEVHQESPLLSDEYLCFDDGDLAYTQKPTYNWIEIDPSNGGNGTHLALNDYGNMGDACTVNMPFPLVIYGESYNQITVCTNGWISGGTTYARDYMNWPIPGTMGPSPMIAPFWDDLTTDSYTGHVSTWFDAIENRFIIEWSEMANEYDTSFEETFEVVLYDVAHYPTSNGNCEILFQYRQINNIDCGSYNAGYICHGQYATVGLEGPCATRGIQYSYNNSYPTAAKPLQNEMAIFFTPVSGSMFSPPAISLSTDSLYFAVDQTGMYQQNFNITNNGIAPLQYTMSIEYQEDASRGQGGPDSFNHVWIDSRESDGPEFSWHPLAANAIPAVFSSNNTATDLIPIGFTFPYYGDEYQQFRINPNGWIGFGEDVSVWNNLSLPNPSAPKPAIMPFWDDLSPLINGNVYYQSTADSLTVWFINVDHTPGNYNGTYTFQTILYPDGDILLQYLTMNGTIESATIGMQNSDNTDALQICYNAPFIEDNLAVLITRKILWLGVSPQSGDIFSNQLQDVSVTVEPQQLLMGTYCATITLSSNDPIQPCIIIPVTMDVVGSVPAIHLSQDCIDFGDVPITETCADTLQIHNFGCQTLQITDIQSTNTTITPQQTAYSIEPFTHAPLIVTFSPTELGLQQAAITLFSNDPTNPELTLEANGTGVENSHSGIPIPPVTALYANYPNPFNPTTTIRFSLAAQDAPNATIEIFNICGQKVKDIPLSDAQITTGCIEWNGRDNRQCEVGSGVYLYRLRNPRGLCIQKKMTLIK